MEDKKNEDQREDAATEDSGTGDKPEEVNQLDRADAINERMEKATKERLEVVKREEALAAITRVSGDSNAGQIAVKPQRLGDIEYATALERGEVNPFKDDGIEGY